MTCGKPVAALRQGDEAPFDAELDQCLTAEPSPRLVELAFAQELRGQRRTQLRVLEKKGHVRHEEHGAKFIYLPAVHRRAARKSALRHLVETFFDGSAENVVGALLGGEGARVTEEELARIAEQVAKARTGKQGESK